MTGFPWSLLTGSTDTVSGSQWACSPGGGRDVTVGTAGRHRFKDQSDTGQTGPICMERAPHMGLGTHRPNGRQMCRQNMAFMRLKCQPSVNHCTPQTMTGSNT